MTLTTFIKSNYFGLIYCLSIYTFADHKRAKLLKVPAIFFMQPNMFIACLTRSLQPMSNLWYDLILVGLYYYIMIALFIYCEWSIFAFDVQLEWEDPL